MRKRWRLNCKIERIEGVAKRITAHAIWIGCRQAFSFDCYRLTIHWYIWLCIRPFWLHDLIVKCNRPGQEQEQNIYGSFAHAYIGLCWLPHWECIHWKWQAWLHLYYICINTNQENTKQVYTLGSDKIYLLLIQNPSEKNF